MEKGGGLKTIKNVRINHLVGHVMGKMQLETVQLDQFDEIFLFSDYASVAGAIKRCCLIKLFC